MGFFSRNNEPEIATVNTKELDQLQRVADQVTDAPALVDSIWEDCKSRGIHPWNGTNEEHAQMGLAALAFVFDKTAEHLKAQCTVETRDGAGMLPDAEGFATPSSLIAAEKLDVANQIVKGADFIEFDEKTITQLNPSFNMPWWPKTSASNTDFESEWQIHDAPVVSGPFMRAMINAGRDIHVEAAAKLQDAETYEFAAIPGEYETLNDLATGVLDSAEEQFGRIEYALDMNGGELTGATKHELYKNLREAFTDTAHMYVAAHCPEVLGPDWLPNPDTPRH
jgi:hypothetical protein